MLAPEGEVGSVDLLDVAEQLVRVDLAQQGLVLKVAQAGEEELWRDGGKKRSYEFVNVCTYHRHTHVNIYM